MIKKKTDMYSSNGNKI